MKNAPAKNLWIPRWGSYYLLVAIWCNCGYIGISRRHVKEGDIAYICRFGAAADLGCKTLPLAPIF